MDKAQTTDSDRLLLSEIFVSVGITSTLTQLQREGLKQLLLENCLSAEESASVDRILRAIRRGKIKVV